MAKLNKGLCWVLPGSAAKATLKGNNAHPETASTETPTHPFTALPATDFALDFMLETRV
jgi:hypothetical protein